MKIVWIVAGVNFAAFIVMTVVIGGDALNGKIDRGRYYVANHGHYTEVTERVFRFSLIQAVVAFGLILMAVLGMGWINRRGPRRRERL